MLFLLHLLQRGLKHEHIGPQLVTAVAVIVGGVVVLIIA